MTKALISISTIESTAAKKGPSSADELTVQTLDARERTADEAVLSGKGY